MYVSIKTIKGTKQAYLQHSYRVGKRVRTKSKYLGPAVNMKAAVSLFSEASREFMAKSIEEIFAEREARDAARAAEENAPVVITGLTVGEWKQETFDIEAMSQKSDAFSA